MLWRMVIRKLLNRLPLTPTLSLKGRGKLGRNGYTLVEAATVVVITGALAIIAVPIASDKIEDSKIATASGTTIAIGTSMAKFFGDTKEWPTAKTFSDVGSQITVIYDALRSGKDAGDANLDPVDDTGSWPITPKDPSGTPILDTTSPVDNMNNHLVSDAPTVTNNPNATPPRHTYTKAGFNWIGPYIPVVDQDPWGKNYLAYVKAMREGRKVDGTRIYGWVLSAGGDGRIQTPITSSAIKGDDVGTLVFSATMVTGVNDRTSIGLSAK